MDTLPVLMQQSDRASSFDAAVYKTVPVLAVFDAAPVQRGTPARFRVRLLDDTGSFAINVRTEDITAQAGVQYEPVSGPRSFIDGGDVVVQTIDDGETDAKEFALVVDAISDMYIVRARATVLIQEIVDTGVYTLDVYEEDVYD